MSDASAAFEYVLNLLSTEERDAFESALEGSPALRAQLASITEVLAFLPEDEIPSRRAPAGLWARIEGGLTPDSPASGLPAWGMVDRLAALFDLPGARIRELLELVAHAPGKPWVASGSPGVSLLDFEGGARVADADCGLVRVEPGASVPRHRHGGDEWCFVLQGCFVEDERAEWLPGDLVHNGEGSVHAFRSGGDRPLVFAVLLFGGMELSD